MGAREGETQHEIEKDTREGRETGRRVRFPNSSLACHPAHLGLTCTGKTDTFHMLPYAATLCIALDHLAEVRVVVAYTADLHCVAAAIPPV